jgi:hypothetical protein
MTPIASRLSRYIVALLFSSLLASAASANVTFQTVTNTNDTGNGSLRAAITAANANGSDGAIISFDIGSGCGPHVIHLNSALPDIKFETHIEGFSQTGASKNSKTSYIDNDEVICIVVAGDNQVADAFTVPDTVADGMTLSVLGLAFSGFTHSAINLRGGSAHLVAGVRTGGKLGGFQMDAVGYGVILAAGVHDAKIGGPDWDGQNQFGDLTNNAIYVASGNGSTKAAHNNAIKYNNVGFVYEGTTEIKLPTLGSGIAVGGKSNALSLISVKYTGASGVHFSNADATQNGLALGSSSFNEGDGVLIDDDASDNYVQNMSISSNGGAGVRVVNGQGNDLTFNNFSSNAGLAIDLAAPGVTANDNDSQQPAPDYANRGLNFPVLTAAKGGHTGVVTGTLTTLPGIYYIDLQVTSTCDPSGHGEGQNGPDYPNGTSGNITVPNITVQGQGSVAFSLPVYFGFFPSQTFFVTALARDAAYNTSEFAACIPYVDDTIFFSNFGN